MSERHHVDTWLEELLQRRADTRWSAEVYASSHTARLFPKIGGYDVRVDDGVQSGKVEIRGDAYDENGVVIGKELKASYTDPSLE